MLPDDVLLCVFYLVRPDYDRLCDLAWWQPVVHVCRRWRGIVFASPNFLELRLVCDPWIPAGLTAIWPPIPIIIWNLANDADRAMPEDYDLDAAIVHPNRVCEIHLQFASSQLQQLASVMEKPFPGLVHLALETFRDIPPALTLPDGFLGGSAPRLKSLELNCIPFPVLPNLLLSATDLVSLTIQDVPHSGYILPEVFVAHLTMLTNLESLDIDFEYFLSHPSRRPYPTRTVLPALTCFQFRGISNYLEDLMARIDAPLLESISITFCHFLISDIPHLTQFVRRTTRIQTLIQPLKEAHVDFHYYGLVVRSLPLPWIPDETSGLTISCVETGWQFSSLAQVFVSLLPSIFMAERLYIHGTANILPQDAEDMQLLELTPAFATVTNLYVPVEFAEFFAPILQERIGETEADVLPALESLCLEGLQPSEPSGKLWASSLLHDRL